jgi:prefoldin subunit 5
MEGKVEQLERKIDDLDAKVTEMHQLLTQAKGARWMLMLMIGFGGFVAAKVTPLVQYALGR